MQLMFKRFGMRVAVLAIPLFAACLGVLEGSASGQAAQGAARGQGAQATGPRITQVVVLDDEKFNVRRLTFPVGYRQEMHTVGADRDELVILITPGQMEGRVDAKVTVATKPGELWAVPKAPSQHAFANIGREPLDILVVQRK